MQNNNKLVKDIISALNKNKITVEKKDNIIRVNDIEYTLPINNKVKKSSNNSFR